MPEATPTEDDSSMDVDWAYNGDGNFASPPSDHPNRPLTASEASPLNRRFNRGHRRLCQRDKTIQEMDGIIAQKDMIIEQKDMIIKQKDDVNEEMRRTIRDCRIDAQSRFVIGQAINDPGQETNELGQKINDLSQEINDLRAIIGLRNEVHGPTNMRQAPCPAPQAHEQPHLGTWPYTGGSVASLYGGDAAAPVVRPLQHFPDGALVAFDAGSDPIAQSLACAPLPEQPPAAPVNNETFTALPPPPQVMTPETGAEE